MFCTYFTRCEDYVCFVCISDQPNILMQGLITYNGCSEFVMVIIHEFVCIYCKKKFSGFSGRFVARNNHSLVAKGLTCGMKVYRCNDV